MYSIDNAIVQQMLQLIDRIENYTSKFNSAEDFYDDTKAYDATIMNFIVLGESVSKLSTEFKNLHKKIEWNKILSFRNILAHNYFGVNVDITWQIIKDKMPKLKQDLSEITKK